MSRLKAFIPALFSLAVVAAPAVTPAHAASNLVAVLEAEIVTLDPHFTPAYISRTFGYMVFDTLFAKNTAGEIKPQMVQDYKVSPDGLVYTFTLRDGLKWHDGAPSPPRTASPRCAAGAAAARSAAASSRSPPRWSRPTPRPSC